MRYDSRMQDGRYTGGPVDDVRARLRHAEQRYKRAALMRFDAVARADDVSLTAANNELRDALRLLLGLGMPLERVEELYAEAVAEFRAGQQEGL